MDYVLGRGGIWNLMKHIWEMATEVEKQIHIFFHGKLKNYESYVSSCTEIATH
jgi:hypothetical protein